MASGGSKSKSAVLGVVFLLLQVLVLLVFIPGSVFQSILAKEVRWLEAVHSDRTVIWVADRTFDWHQRLTRDTGVSDGLSWMFIPDTEARDRSGAMDRLGSTFWFPFVEGRGQALDALAHLILFRLATLATWLPMFLLIVAPSFFDGMVERKIKQCTFSYPSPMKHKYGTVFAVSVGFVMLVALFAPVPIPPLLLPVGLLLSLSVVGVMVIGNMPKRL